MPTTTTELFSQGCAIDLLGDNRLKLWNEGRELIASEIEFNGESYTPAQLDPSLQQTLRLPAWSEDVGSIESQIGKASDIFGDFGFDEQHSLLLAGACFATWTAECIPGGAPLVNFWGPPGSEASVLGLMNAIVRRPLAVDTPSLKELLALPAGLWPTLIVRNPSDRWIRILLAGTTEGARSLRAGCVSTMHCSAIVYTPRPIAVPCLKVPLIAAELRGRTLRPGEADDMAAWFQPRLLQYRLRYHVQVRNSQFDVTDGFGPSTRMLARQLCASVEGASGVQGKIVEALRGINETDMVCRSQEPSALVTEALLVADHECKGAIYVWEIAELASTISTWRQNPIELSPKAAGEILRNELGLSTKRQAPGYQVLLDEGARKRIHDLARAHGTLTLLEPRADCRFCGAIGGDPSRSSAQST